MEGKLSFSYDGYRTRIPTHSLSGMTTDNVTKRIKYLHTPKGNLSIGVFNFMQLGTHEVDIKKASNESMKIS